jgi:hypothetical protein
MNSVPAFAGRSHEAFSPVLGEKVFLCPGTGSNEVGASPSRRIFLEQAVSISRMGCSRGVRSPQDLAHARR